MQPGEGILRIYLDVSCLNWPFDDQTQTRIRLEAEAVLLIMQRMDDSEWSQVSSDAAVLEVDQIADPERRKRVQALLQNPDFFVQLTSEVFARAAVVEALGFKPADALHVAAAEAGRSDALLTCDDRMCRAGLRNAAKLLVLVRNPLTWLNEVGNATNP
jgi:predicted nucleic acid-binding protein